MQFGRSTKIFRFEHIFLFTVLGRLSAIRGTNRPAFRQIQAAILVRTRVTLSAIFKIHPRLREISRISGARFFPAREGASSLRTVRIGTSGASGTS
jgi:hypothetical protein